MHATGVWCWGGACERRAVHFTARRIKSYSQHAQVNSHFFDSGLDGRILRTISRWLNRANWSNRLTVTERYRMVIENQRLHALPTRGRGQPEAAAVIRAADIDLDHKGAGRIAG